MAFDVKKINKAKNRDADEDNIQTVDSETATTNQIGKNKVATHSWVYNALKPFWNWTNFFVTKTLKVDEGAKIGSINTGEVQTNDLYTKRIYLVGKDGKTMAIYLDEEGNLVRDYDYEDVFLYPTDGVSIRRFVYRYGNDPCSIPTDAKAVARNFVGLTPYEILMNFVNYVSNGYTEYGGKTCFKLCEADGKEELVRKTLLFTAPTNHKITRVTCFDRESDEPTLIYEVPSDKTFKRMTVNMPTFNPEVGDAAHVLLPGEFPAIGGDAYIPFMPPFLKPTKPDGFLPPVPPFAPPPPWPTYPTNDIFDDDESPVTDEDLYQDSSSSDQETTPSQPFDAGTNFTVSYEDYETNTYFNLALNKNKFAANKEQFLKVETQAVD